MKHYDIFGGCLRSDIPLDELLEIEAADPQWVVRLTPVPSGSARFLGEEVVDERTRVRCSRLADGVRLEFDDTGTFDITRGGTDISWSPGPDPRPELVRADVLGGVLGTALHLHGVLCLHGSSVSIDKKGVVFLAPKGTGKSTLAAALTRAGASFLSDDMVPLEIGSPPMVWPATPTVRLLPDSAVRLGVAGASPPQGSGGKYHHAPFRGREIERERVPLAAIYELAPVARASASTPVRRIRLAGPTAVTTLLRNHRCGDVLGKADSRALFSRAVDIAGETPVYRLELVRDLDDLGEVAAGIVRWHSVTDRSTES